MPVEMTIKADTESVGRMLQRMINPGRNLRPVQQNIAETGLASIQRNFEEGGWPKKWKTLAPATLARKKNRAGKSVGQVLIGDKRLLFKAACAAVNHVTSQRRCWLLLLSCLCGSEQKPMIPIGSADTSKLPVRQ